MATLTEASPTIGRLRAAWSAAHTPVAGVPSRWLPARTVEGQPLPVGHLLTTYDWHFVVLAVSYAPPVLWGPLVGVVTVAYWQRRRRATSTVQ